MIADLEQFGHQYAKEWQRRAFKPQTAPAGFVCTITPVGGHEVHALIGGSDLIPGNWHGQIHNRRQTQTQIVMIHGALASRRYLLPTAKLLAKYVRVLVPEMPGHGASSKPRHALSVAEQAQVLFEWFCLNRLGRAHIFANSYGCQVAAQLTASHPQIVDRLILSGPTVDPQAPTLLEQAYRLFIDGFFEPSGAQAQLYADLSDMSIPLAFETAKQMIADDIRPKLAQISCRTLVLRGENDPIAPQLWTEEVAARINDARFGVIPKAPHCVNYAAPEQLARILMKFINEP